MFWNDDSGPVPTLTREQLLALTREKANTMGARRHRQVGAGLLGVLMLSVGLLSVAAWDRPGPKTELETVSGGLDTSTIPTTTSDASATTSTSSAASAVSSTVPLPPGPPATVAPFSASPTTSPTATTVAETTTTTTTLACRNSFDPVCGPFRWDPPPGPNQPLTVTVSATPTSPSVGQTVTFRVLVQDPDGNRLLDTSARTVDYGDGSPFGGVGGHVDCVSGYGPWTTPTPVPVHEELAFEHAYANIGSYRVTFKFNALGDCAHGPSEGTATATVTVTN